MEDYSIRDATIEDAKDIAKYVRVLGIETENKEIDVDISESAAKNGLNSNIAKYKVPLYKNEIIGYF